VDRRNFLVSSLGLGIGALGACATFPATESVRAQLQQAVGRRETAAGLVAVVIDEGGTRITTHGSTGVSGLAMNGDTVFEIGSLTKVMTALLLAEMASRGEVSFDDPVARYLPPPAKLQPHGRPITLLDLATYTSGLPRMPDNMPAGWNTSNQPLAGYTTEMLFAFLENYRPPHEAGTHYEYANYGFGLLGAVLARRAGKSYEDLLIERICDPLGLDHTRITLTPEMQARAAQGRDLGMERVPMLDMPGLQGAGAVRSTVRDVVRFLETAMALRQSPLAKPFARLLETRRPTPLPRTQAALGWFVSSGAGEEIAWKSGATSGFGACAAFSTRRRRGAVVLSNFLWRAAEGAPADAGLVGIAMNLIDPQFQLGDLRAIYR
jgi:CubicO group peptidase (beta-lactamase class C family)